MEKIVLLSYIVIAVCQFRSDNLA